MEILEEVAFFCAFFALPSRLCLAVYVTLSSALYPIFRPLYVTFPLASRSVPALYVTFPVAM